MKNNETTDNAIGARLRGLRKQLDLSQKEIAEKLGITPAYWSALELGNRELTGNILRSLISEFSISADWLLIGKGANARNDLEKEIDEVYTRIIWVVELIERLLATTSYDNYLQEIGAIIKHLRASKKVSRQEHLGALRDALNEEFFELFHSYFLMANSDRTKTFKPFSPPRIFAKVIFDN